MNVLADFYKQLAAHLLLIVDNNDQPVIKHIDFWNRQFDGDYGETIQFPAVFLEFKSLPWQTTGRHKQLSQMRFDLHLASTTKAKSKYNAQFTDRFLAQLELLDATNYWLTGFGGSFFGSISRINTMHDHYYSDIVEHVVSYRCVLADDAAMRNYTKVEGDKLLISLNAGGL